MAENDPRDTRVLELLGRNLASECAAVDEVRVLRRDLNGGLGGRKGKEEVQRGRGDDDLCV